MTINFKIYLKNLKNLKKNKSFQIPLLIFGIVVLAKYKSKSFNNKNLLYYQGLNLKRYKVICKQFNNKINKKFNSYSKKDNNMYNIINLFY